MQGSTVHPQLCRDGDGATEEQKKDLIEIAIFKCAHTHSSTLIRMAQFLSHHRRDFMLA